MRNRTLLETLKLTKDLRMKEIIWSLWRGVYVPAPFPVDVQEQLTGVVDGINCVFTTSQSYVSGTLILFLNGLKESGFTEVDDITILMDEAPKIAGFSDKLEGIYTIKK